MRAGGRTSGVCWADELALNADQVHCSCISSRLVGLVSSYQITSGSSLEGFVCNLSLRTTCRDLTRPALHRCLHGGPGILRMEWKFLLVRWILAALTRCVRKNCNPREGEVLHSYGWNITEWIVVALRKQVDSTLSSDRDATTQKRSTLGCSTILCTSSSVETFLLRKFRLLLSKNFVSVFVFARFF